MKLVDLKVTEFINEVDSKAVTPGGGSVSALASSIGVALVRMVGHVTVNKKKFRALDQDIQDKYNNVVNSLLSVKEELILLVDKDTDAFNLIMSAFRLPKETTEEKAVRKQAILEGTIEAIKVPYRVAEISLKALKDIMDNDPPGLREVSLELKDKAYITSSVNEGYVMINSWIVKHTNFGDLCKTMAVK